MAFDDSQVNRTHLQNASSAATYLDTSHKTAGQPNNEYTYNTLTPGRVATLEAPASPAEASPSRAARRAHNRRLARARAKAERAARHSDNTSSPLAEVTQLAEATDSNSDQCGFDSHPGHNTPTHAGASSPARNTDTTAASTPSPTNGASDRHRDTQISPRRTLAPAPRLSYTRRRANLGRFRLVPRFAAAITGLFTTPAPHHNQGQDNDQAPTTTGNRDGDEDLHGPDLPDTHTRILAAGINLLVNTTCRARTAWSVRGELTAWRTAMTDLPDTFDDAVDTLTVFEDRLIAQLHHDINHLAPTIRRLNANQPSPTCWALPVPTTALRSTWTGRGLWITAAMDCLNTTLGTPKQQRSHTNRLSLVTALAHSATGHGRNVTASNHTIATRAITTYGCTLAISTAIRRLQQITSTLRTHNLMITHAHGRYLTSTERCAAYAHHGHRQTRAANTSDLTLPNHLHPTPQPPSPRPAYATRLTHRLHARDQQESKTSPYSYTHRFSSSLGNHRVAHRRATAREHRPIPHPEALRGPSGHPAGATHNTNTPHTTAPTSHQQAHTCPDTPTPARKTPSLRAWRIADDLTRVVDGCAAANGPYAALVGPDKNQCRLVTLARLIDTHTPSWASTRDVMRSIAHTATSKTTGHIALGLPRHRTTLPHNPTGWLTTLITHLTWHDTNNHPTWNTTATAFGVTWNGTRHKWQARG